MEDSLVGDFASKADNHLAKRLGRVFATHQVSSEDSASRSIALELEEVLKERLNETAED